MTTKHCTRCSKLLPATPEYFPRTGGKAGGLRSRCKNCTKVAHRRWNDEHREENQASRRRWNAEHREENRAHQRHRAALNGEKVEVHRAVADAIRIGLFPRPRRCSICGSAGRNLWHHEDYSHPYSAVPLCPRCHKHLHAGRFTLVPYYSVVRGVNGA